MFFEAIREDDMDLASPATLFLDQLEVGQAYELVITNLTGECGWRLAAPAGSDWVLGAGCW